MYNETKPFDCFPEGNTGNDAKLSSQDLLNSVALNNDLKSFIAGKTPDDATLDLLLEYPETAKDWLIKAAFHIHDLEIRAGKSVPIKPKLDGLDDQDIILCPACGNGLIAADDPDFLIPKYCSECGQLLQWNEVPVAKSDHKNTIYASRCPALYLKADNLEALATRLLSEYLGKEIKARYSQDQHENPNYWGFQVDETPLSKEEIGRLFTLVDADDDTRDSTDFGVYPIMEICKGAAEALLSQTLPFGVDHSLGSPCGVWFFGESVKQVI